MVVASLPGFGDRLARQMAEDSDFAMNSRRVRLEALATYCDTALRFLAAGVMKKGKKELLRAPDTTSLTAVLPELDESVERRWYEAQKCRHAGAYLASIVMMGSVLEALLLARANLSPADSYRSNAAPQKKDGSPIPIQDWTLNSLIDVAAERGWIKIDRKNFSHALRDSRNVVHPWHEVSTGADFDQSTCDMCWQVLKASVEDLLASI